MFNNGSHQFSILHNRLEHFRNSVFLKYTFFLTLHRQVDVNGAAFSAGDLSRQAFFGEVNLSRVGFVKLDHRSHACDLEGEGRRIGNRDGGNDVVHEDRGLLAVD